MATKRCSRCHEEKALEGFASRKDAPDGKRGYCLACESKRTRAVRLRTEAPVAEPTAPLGVKGTSTLYGIAPDGTATPRLQWLKTSTTKDSEYDALLKGMERIADKWRGKAKPAKAPKHADKDLMCVYPVGDPHFGALSWREETGHDFNLKMAEDNLITAVDKLVDLAPSAETGLFLPLGDNSHIDNTSSTTTAGTRQDSDTRWAKIQAVLIRAFRRCIDRGLTKHKRMLVRVEIGNHDSHAAIMLALCLAQFYERDPRVIVDTSPCKFWYHRFDQVLIASTHTDTVKREQLPLIMAVDRPQDWGATKHRYVYTGHLHHERSQEFPGCIVYTLRTLAPRDKWHTDAGYRSGQDMRIDVIHRKFGLINRHIVGIDQILEAS